MSIFQLRYVLAFTLILLQSTFAYCYQSYFGQVPEKALFNYGNGNFEKSISIVLKADSLNSSSVLLHFLGRCHWNNFHYDSAQFYYEKSILVNQAQPNELIKSELGLIDIALKQGEILQAIDLFKKIIKITQEYGISIDLPEIQLRKANITYYTNYSKVESNLRHVFETMKDDHPDKFQLYISYLDILMTQSSPKVDSVLTSADTFLKEYFPQDLSKLCKLLIFKAFHHFDNEEFYQSIHVFENEVYPLVNGKKARWALFLKSEYHRLSNYPYSQMRDLVKVSKNHKEYLELAKLFYKDDHFRFAESYLSLSSLYGQLGRKELSLAYIDQAIKLLEKSEYTGNYLVAIYQKGLAAFNNNDFNTSKKMFQLLLTKESPTVEYDVYKAYAHYYLANIFFINSDFMSALTAIDNCINFTDHKLEAVDLYGLKFKILRKDGQANKANMILTDILTRIEENGTNQKISHIQFLNDYSQYLVDSARYKEALSHIGKIISENEEIIESNNPLQHSELKRLLVRSFYQKGKAYEELYDLNSKEEYLSSAYESYVKGLTILNQVKKAYKSKKDRTEHINQLKSIYQKCLKVSHQLLTITGDLNYQQKAFQFAESYLSNQLLEELNRNIAIQQNSIPDSVLLQIENLRQQASFFISEITSLQDLKVLDPNDSAKLETYRFSLTKNKGKYNTTLRYLEENFTNYYNFNYEENLASISEIQKRLHSNEALIEYFVTDQAFFVFCISHEKSSLLKLPAIDSLLFAKFQETIHSGNFSDKGYNSFAKASNHLYEKVLSAPMNLLDKEKIDKIYIIPDGQLNFIPFELLITEKPEETETSFNTLNYLIKDMSISYAYSSSVLFHQISSKKLYRGKFLAFAPSYQPEIRANSNNISRKDRWKELVYNQKEVSNIKDYFNGRILSEKNANERSFIENHSNYDILHLAMHANTDIDNPHLSKLVFSPVVDSLYDSYLHSFEIYNMRINSQLTVLSACNTGSGNLINGEGVMSLARAFTYAGSDAVVMSHWEVDDQSTNELMQSFYKYLADKKTKSEALRLAKIDYLNTASPNKQHPFFWGAFVMIGNDSPIKTQGSSWLYLLIVIPGIYFTSLLYVKIKKMTSA